MSAPNASTFEASPQPYRPGKTDFEGCSLQNHPRFAPVPGTHPTAGLINTFGYQLIAACAMVPAAVVTIQQIAGAYTVLFLASPNTTLVAADVAITKNGTGDVTVTLLNSKLTAQIARAMVTLNEDIDAFIRAVDVNSGTPARRGARVKMKTVASSPAAVEGGFTLAIY